MAKKPHQHPTESDIRRLQHCYAMLGSSNRHERDSAFGQSWSILRRYNKEWSDLLSLISAPSGTTGINPADRLTLREQHELLGGSPDEREAARTAINWILERYRCTWNDLLGIISGTANTGQPMPIIPLPMPTAPDPLELLTGFIPQFVDMTDDEVIALSLWIIHTYFYDQYEITPRLAFTSPVPGCGKSTSLKIIRLLGATPLKTDGISPAAIYHTVDRARRTLLIDEAENMAWMTNRDLRAVVDSGHSKEGCITRLRKGEPHSYSTFSPMALGVIGDLPLTIMRRSIVIHMKMTRRDLKRVEMHQDDFDVVRRHIIDWAQGRKLDLNPVMPDALKNRVADNWRVLTAIADACGGNWGTIVRDAAVRLSSRYSDDDLKLILLADIKIIFDADAIDRIATGKLVGALIDLEGQPWSEYRGLEDDKVPRRLSAGVLANLLRPFGIRSRTVWPPSRTSESRSARGFYRRQFEQTWPPTCRIIRTQLHSRRISRWWGTISFTTQGHKSLRRRV